MIAVQWVLSLLLVVAIIFVLLLFFVPAWLERQSRANVKQRQTLAEDIQAQERAARALERALIPYARGRSAHFVAGTAAARERLDALLDGLAAAGSTLAAMRCPTVHDYLLPIQHFWLAPRDAAAIWGDTRRAARLRGQLRRIAADSAAAEAALAAIRAE